MITNVVPISSHQALDTCRVCRRHVERCTCFLGPVSVPLHREFIEEVAEAARIGDRHQTYAMYAILAAGLVIGFAFGVCAGFLWLPR